MLVVSCHPSLSSLPNRPCSISYLVTPPKWPAPRMGLLNHKQHSLLASLSLSLLSIRCAMPRCWQTRSPNTRLMHGFLTPVGLALALPPVVNVARKSFGTPLLQVTSNGSTVSSILVQSLMPSTQGNLQRLSTKPTRHSISMYQNHARMFLTNFSIPLNRGRVLRTSRQRLPSWASCSMRTLRNIPLKLRRMLSKLVCPHNIRQLLNRKY